MENLDTLVWIVLNIIWGKEILPKDVSFVIEHGHLAKNYMNTSRIEDEKKVKVDNIQKKMRQQWIPKPTEDTSSSNDGQVTQELGDSTISIKFSR